LNIDFKRNKRESQIRQQLFNNLLLKNLFDSFTVIFWGSYHYCYGLLLQNSISAQMHSPDNCIRSFSFCKRTHREAMRGRCAGHQTRVNSIPLGFD